MKVVYAFNCYSCTDCVNLLTSLDAFHLPSLFNMGASVPDSAVVGSSVAIVVVDMVGGRSVVMSLPLL